MTINVNIMYNILTDFIKNSPGCRHITYSQLSDYYFSITRFRVDPHYEWNEPLGSLNEMVHQSFKAPPLSVLVVSSKNHLPGDGFWESAGNVPRKPKGPDIGTTVNRLIDDVLKHPWH